MKAVFSVVGLGVAVAVPFVVGPRLPVYTNAAIFVVVFTSLSLLVRLSGQVSLCHAALAAIGAAAFSHLLADAGLPWLMALLLAGLVTVPVGALIALPAIRLSGLYLALATYGFGVLVERLLFHTGIMFGSSGGIPVPRPGVLGLSSGRGFYYVALAAAVLSCALVASVQRSRLGRILGALAYSPRALTALGTSVNVTRVIVFCLSAFMAGVAGGLFGALSGSIDGTGFSDTTSLLWLALVFIAGRGVTGASIGASLLIAVVPDYLGSSSVVSTWEPIAFGAGALVVALAAGPARAESLRLWSARAADRADERRRRSPVAARTAGAPRSRPAIAAPEAVAGR